jgi:uncharacterized damage-inducible protein DinB
MERGKVARSHGWGDTLSTDTACRTLEGATAMLNAVRTLYAYNAWANLRVLDNASELSAAQFVPDTGCGSLRDTLVHIASAQWTWLQRWQGTPPVEPWDPAKFADLAALKSRWADVESDTARSVAELSDSDLERIVSYVNYQGETWGYPLWQQLLHQVNHATQHRSEAALQLTSLERSPGWLDFLYYLDEVSARPAAQK